MLHETILPWYKFVKKSGFWSTSFQVSTRANLFPNLIYILKEILLKEMSPGSHSWIIIIFKMSKYFARKGGGEER